MTALADTSVIIDHLRGDDRATALVLNVLTNGSLACSRLTMVELAVGLRKHQAAAMRAMKRYVDVVDVDESIGMRAVQLATRWGPSHGAIDVTDYVVAATAEVRGMQLLTLNVKHFPMFDGLTAPY